MMDADLKEVEKNAGIKYEKGEEQMKNKGLCITCVNDKGCTFSRKFPVLQCEEFTNYESRPLKAKRRKNKQKIKSN